MKGYRSNKLATGRVCSLLSAKNQIVPAANDISWPHYREFIEEQKIADGKPNDGTRASNGVLRKEGCMWIPEKATGLNLKILVASHCGTAGHRGVEATCSIVRGDFTWKGLQGDVRDFLKNWLHCIVTRDEEIIPRPLGTALHGSRPNEVLHCDYLFMGPSHAGDRYVLIVRDDLSSHCSFWPTTSPTADSATEALATWTAAFGAFDWIVTDQGTHFVNNLLKGLIEELRSKHHTTTAYCPWANGSVERVYREVLRAGRALTHEFRLSPKDWSPVLESVQSVLNQSPLKRLGLRDRAKPGIYRTPLEAFTGLKPTHPILRALPLQRYTNCATVSEVRARQLMKVEQIQDALELMHRDVNE